MDEIERLRREVARGAGPDVVRRLLQLLEAAQRPTRERRRVWRQDWLKTQELEAHATRRSRDRTFRCSAACDRLTRSSRQLLSMIARSVVGVCPGCVRIYAETASSASMAEGGDRFVWTFAALCDPESTFGTMDEVGEQIAAIRETLLVRGFQGAAISSWPFPGQPSRQHLFTLDVIGDPIQFVPERVPEVIEEAVRTEIPTAEILWPTSHRARRRRGVR